MSKLTGYKGFNADWTCRDYKFEVGGTYTHEGAIKLCAEGFHFTEHPLDVLSYYPPTGKIAVVEADNVSPETSSDDTKRVCSTLHIKAELTIRSLVEAAVKFVFDRADWSKKELQATGTRGAASATGTRGAASATGDNGAASATGYNGAASATGDNGAASATGYNGAASATGYNGAASATGTRGAASATGTRGAASATGDNGAASVFGPNSVAVAAGREGKAQGVLGCWIVLTERDSDWNIVAVKSFKVDGKKIKEKVFYTLRNGKAVQVL